MSQDTNQVILIGRLTRDAELKYSQAGMAIGKIGLAVGRRVKKGDEWTDETSFFDVTIFGKTAENLNKYLLKGTQICVVGEIKQDRWEQDGQKRSSVNIIGNHIQLLGKPNQGDAAAQAAGAQKPAPKDPVGADYGSDFDDDIPF